MPGDGRGRPRVRPTAEELATATDRTVPDLVAPGLRVLFCGINPGLWSGATGHHFAKPGNRFWKVLHLAGFTDTLLDPAHERLLLPRGLGITNLVNRTTATADQLTTAEVRQGAERLALLVEQMRPECVAFLGMGAYRTAFRRPRAGLGAQEEQIAGARLWLLPNPSGLQARYQLPELVELFTALRVASGIEAAG